MDNKYKPLISVCIPTYNGEKFLQEALDSVKSQTYENIEIIVSDDLSKDNTLKVVESFKEKVDFPIFIYSHTPSGIGANWNNCIEKSNGEYIKLLFQDDILKPNCLELMFQYLINNDLEIVLSKRNIINDKSQLVFEGEWYNKYNDLQNIANLSFKDFIIFNKKMINKINFKKFLLENILGEPCVSLFSKKLYLTIGKYDTNLNQILDYIYFLRVLEKFNIGIIEEKLVSFRVHNEQASNLNHKNNLDESKQKIEIISILFYKDLKIKNKIILSLARLKTYIKPYIKPLLN